MNSEDQISKLIHNKYFSHLFKKEECCACKRIIHYLKKKCVYQHLNGDLYKKNSPVTRSKRCLLRLAGMNAKSVVEIVRNGPLDRLAIMRPRAAPSRPVSTTPMSRQQEEVDDDELTDLFRSSTSSTPSTSDMRSKSPRSILKKPSTSPFTLYGRKRAKSTPPTVIGSLDSTSENQENEPNNVEKDVDPETKDTSE